MARAVGVLGLIFMACHAGAQMAPRAVIANKQDQRASMGDLMRERGTAPMHIFYVHGIGARGPNDSGMLRESICGYLKNCAGAWVSTGREYADEKSYKLGTEPPAFRYWGQPVWANSTEWAAAAPFVDHYEVMRRNGQKILLDEINWWPLTWALKCRGLVRSEASLPGPAKDLIGLCSTAATYGTNTGRYQFYPWISEAEAKQLQALPSHGAKVNRELKASLLDWGFSEATLAVGPMQELIVEGIGQLIGKSVAFHGGMGSGSQANEEFVFVTHSLGSYLMFAALKLAPWETRAPSCDCENTPREDIFTEVLRRTPQVYFLANQVELLELATLKGHLEMKDSLARWGSLRGDFMRAHGKTEDQPQLVTWNDPSDLLTWLVPDIEGVHVDNFKVQNALHWFWLFENPTKAHDNYPQRREVMKSLLEPKKSAGARP